MKRVVIIITIIMGVILIFNNNKTQYKTVEEQIKKGNKIAFMVEQEDGKYEQVKELPTSGYTYNQEKSKCSNNASAIYSNGSIKISNLSKKNTSCYLYFDIEESKKTLDVLGLESKGDIGNSFTGPSCDANTNSSDHTTGSCANSEKGVYETNDDYGTSYYFRGTVDNNWVKIGDLYFRIIRINGNGTIRLIYSGNEANKSNIQIGNGKWSNGWYSTINNGSSTTGKAYNTTYNNNTYVGFYYGSTTEIYPGNHSNEHQSVLVSAINSWYTSSGLSQYADKLDGATGWCNDRQINTEGENWYNGDTKIGYGTSATAYAPLGRLYSGGSYKLIQVPTLKCGEDYYNHTRNQDAYDRDLYTYNSSQNGNNVLEVPVGLITADEVIFAGGFNGTNNFGYWLYTGKYFWTMSPRLYGGNGAEVFIVYYEGALNGENVNSTTPGVRPVINLKADTKFKTNDTGEKGTINNPYVVEVQ